MFKLIFTFMLNVSTFAAGEDSCRTSASEELSLYILNSNADFLLKSSNTVMYQSHLHKNCEVSSEKFDNVMSEVNGNPLISYALETLFPKVSKKIEALRLSVFFARKEDFDVPYDGLFFPAFKGKDSFIFLDCGLFERSVNIHTIVHRLSFVLGHELVHYLLSQRKVLNFPSWIEEVAANFVEIELEPKRISSRAEALNRERVLRFSMKNDQPLCTNIYDSLFFFGLWLNRDLNDFVKLWVKNDKIDSPDVEAEILNAFCKKHNRGNNKICDLKTLMLEFYYKMALGSSQEGSSSNVPYWQGFNMRNLKPLDAHIVLQYLDAVVLHPNELDFLFSRYSKDLEFYLVEPINGDPRMYKINTFSDMKRNMIYANYLNYVVLAVRTAPTDLHIETPKELTIPIH